MIDFEKIGRRILEERKYLRRISQEKMAEDLGMYQADISNLEKAKNGSGITDLSKLDLIADYFDLPLEILLFGRRQDQMEKYYGTKMQLKEYTKKRSQKHDAILRNLLGLKKDEEGDKALGRIQTYSCGPYMIYIAEECQYVWVDESKEDDDRPFGLLKQHFYVVYQDEVIACMTADVTWMLQYVDGPTFETLKTIILPDVFDLDDALQMLNPFWILSKYAVTTEEKEEIDERLQERMNRLAELGEERVVFLIESAYVREDCRRNGIMRMMLDTLKQESNGSIIWLNLEPTSGEELSLESGYHAVYAASELGQINMNASIAEHLGFTVDTKTVERQAERIAEDGTIFIDTIPVRRIAYFFPEKIRDLLKEDDQILSHARAREKVLDGDIKKPSVYTISQGAWKDYGYIIAIKIVCRDETVYAFARGKDWKSRWLGVSKENPAPTGKLVDTIERYDYLKDAENSKYYLGLKVAEQLLGSIYFGTVKPEDVKLDDLRL